MRALVLVLTITGVSAFQPENRAELVAALTPCCVSDTEFNNNCYSDGTLDGSNGGTHISEWDTSKITDFTGVFSGWGTGRGCFKYFNADISAWDVSSGAIFVGMFGGAASFNQDISGWDINPHLGQDTLREMFSHALSFNQNLEAWNIQESLQDTMFSYTKSMTKPVSWTQSGYSSACWG